MLSDFEWLAGRKQIDGVVSATAVAGNLHSAIVFHFFTSSTCNPCHIIT
jgi:hypothetical protein